MLRKFILVIAIIILWYTDSAGPKNYCRLRFTSNARECVRECSSVKLISSSREEEGSMELRKVLKMLPSEDCQQPLPVKFLPLNDALHVFLVKAKHDNLIIASSAGP